MTAAVAGSFVGAALSLYDLAHPILFDMGGGTQRTDTGVLERLIDHDGSQYRVTVRSGAGTPMADGYRHHHLGRREAAVEAAFQRLASRRNAGTSLERRSFRVTALASEVQCELQAAGQAHSFAEICDAVRMLNTSVIEVEAVGARGPAIGTKVFPEIRMEDLPAGDTQIVVRFNDSPKTARRLGLTPGEPLS